MKRRGERERPPIPDWVLGRNPHDDLAARAAWGEEWRTWCAENGYDKLEVLFAARDAHRKRWGIDAAA